MARLSAHAPNRSALARALRAADASGRTPLQLLRLLRLAPPRRLALPSEDDDGEDVDGAHARAALTLAAGPEAPEASGAFEDGACEQGLQGALAATEAEAPPQSAASLVGAAAEAPG